MRKRTLAREYVLKILYQIDITKLDINVVVDRFWEDEREIDKEIKDFAQRLIFGVHGQLDTVDKRIAKYATNWQLKRMVVIDRNILRLGAYELLFASDIPPKVTINEAVELAKKYGDLESSKFVNGILDKINKKEVTPTQ